ncbi:hypothetical protein ACH4VQ_37215 [Streptomyces anulatus]
MGPQPAPRRHHRPRLTIPARRRPRTQVRELTGQLAQALHHARTTEGARALLQEQVYAQDESLRHAQDYIHQVEAELSEQREQARLLQLEVGVLRKQNQRFVEEQAHTISRVSTQATGFDAALAARAARQATEAAQQTARPKPDGMPPDPHRPRPPDPVPIGEIRPGRDTLAFLVLAAAAWTAGAVFAAGIRADPGPSVWKLIIAAVVILLVAAVPWVGYLFVMKKYDPSLDSGPAVFTVPALPGDRRPLVARCRRPGKERIAPLLQLTRPQGFSLWYRI